jgi:hypothetical protein
MRVGLCGQSAIKLRDYPIVDAEGAPLIRRATCVELVGMQCNRPPFVASSDRRVGSTVAGGVGWRGGRWRRADPARVERLVGKATPRSAGSRFGAR